MTSQQLVEAGRITAVERETFSAAQWLSYFEGNKNSKANLAVPESISIDESVSKPIIRSLQRFQIGETGDGKYLKKYARSCNDAVYEKCIELFIREENVHAEILAKTIGSMGGGLISWHWSDLVFRGLRRVLGLKTEIFVLLIAEIIGKCFYKACADHLDNRTLRETFTAIVMDEIFHLEFHCTFMRREMLRFNPVARRFVYFAWQAMFLSACFVFIADHRAALTALKVSPASFFKDCTGTFDHAAVKALL